MEDQERLDKEIGTKEVEKLKPEEVKIEQVEIKPVGEEKKRREKLVCYCKHSAQEEPIKISSVRYEKEKEIKTTGLWYNEGDDELIQKGSALALFLNFVGAKTIRELEGKSVMTAEDDRGYLCFKAY